MDQKLDERTVGDGLSPAGEPSLDLTTEQRLPTSAQHWPLTTIHRPPSTDYRIVLFDIDGTLIKAVRRPEYRGAMREILVGVFGTFGRIGEVDFGGKTDLAIYREALEPEGIAFDAIRERLPSVEAAMVELMDRMASTGAVYSLCPGVQELLEALSRDKRFVISLLTGNVERLAEAKLRVAGIAHYFRERGAFGSDDEERDHLPAIAAERISGSLGRDFPAHRFVIIGDTPRDIKCARHFGARVVAVASGQHSVEQLEPHSPDALLADLSDTEAVLRLLADL
ncbi:MAG TPA: HAD family hydrolase [Blastocatellia bacterium]|nr:HAD family hydrolase [Blastocatellia bacterium]